MQTTMLNYSSFLKRMFTHLRDLSKEQPILKAQKMIEELWVAMRPQWASSRETTDQIVSAREWSLESKWGTHQTLVRKVPIVSKALTLVTVQLIIRIRDWIQSQTLRFPCSLQHQIWRKKRFKMALWLQASNLLKHSRKPRAKICHLARRTSFMKRSRIRIQ